MPRFLDIPLTAAVAYFYKSEFFDVAGNCGLRYVEACRNELVRKIFLRFDNLVGYDLEYLEMSGVPCHYQTSSTLPSSFSRRRA